MQAIYNFASRLRGIHSCVEFRDTLWTCKQSCKVRKPTRANFDLGLSGLTPLLHIWKLFFINFWGVVYAYKFIFELTIFLLSWQNVKFTCGFVLQSDWYRQNKVAEVDNFSRGCYQALSSPCFWGESLGMGLDGNCYSSITRTYRHLVLGDVEAEASLFSESSTRSEGGVVLFS